MYLFRQSQCQAALTADGPAVSELKAGECRETFWCLLVTGTWLQQLGGQHLWQQNITSVEAGADFKSGDAASPGSCSGL